MVKGMDIYSAIVLRETGEVAVETATSDLPYFCGLQGFGKVAFLGFLLLFLFLLLAPSSRSL